MNIQGKKICVIGLGKSGLSAALLLKRHKAQVFVSDSGVASQVKDNFEILKKEGIGGEIGGHTPEIVNNCDLLVRSPGVNDSAQPLVLAKQKGISIVSEIEAASWFCPSPVIAVTGTNGKSTTITLIGQLLKDAQKDVRVCGNIGNPFSGEVDTLSKDTIVVLEISSFQLQNIINFKPKVAVILNITQNHLDRHTDLEEYAKAKFKVVQNQDNSDWCILNYDDVLVRRISDSAKSKRLFFSTTEKVTGAYKDGQFLVLNNGNKAKVVKQEGLLIKGLHNFENAAASVLAAAIFGVSSESAARTLKSFKGLEHRCEYVDQIQGVNFVNDSKATSVDATMRALECMDGRTVLIAGGRDKGSNFKVAKDIIKKKVSHMVLIGEATGKLEKEFSGVVGITKANDLKEAVASAYQQAKEGKRVLLSPMCASFDQFQDFEHRGRVFKESVKKLSLAVARSSSPEIPKRSEGKSRKT